MIGVKTGRIEQFVDVFRGRGTLSFMSASLEIAEKVIAELQAATAASRGSKFRRGNLIELDAEAGDDVLIAADLHGNRLNFDRLLRLADLDNHPRRHLVMQEVCHGGPVYPGGSGCMSHLMLEDVARLKAKFADRFHFLLSNHELAELTEFPITKGSRMLNLSFRCGMHQLYGCETDRIRAAYGEFLVSCPLGVRLASGVAVTHSAPERVDQDGFDSGVFQRPLTPEDLAPHGPVFDLVWGRDFREENAEAFAAMLNSSVLVHGHEPCTEGFQVPNSYQVILDCCGRRASYLLLPLSGRLTQGQVVSRLRSLW